MRSLIESEKRAGNPVAAIVDSLALERNASTLLLRNELDAEEDSDEDSPPQPPCKAGARGCIGRTVLPCL